MAREALCPFRPGAIGTAIASALALGAALSFAACRTPAVVGPAQQGRVDDVLRGADTEGDMTIYLGTAPRVCLDASATTRLCEWIVGNRRRAYAPLARAIGSQDQIGVLCELPVDGSARAPGSCTAHPRRSNRYAEPDGAPAAATPAVSAAPPALVAERELEGARTLVELSRLMGTAPLACAPAGRPTQQRCMWQLTSRTYGHGTVAAWIQAPVQKQLELHCVLPRDGRPRTFESCSANLP